MTNTSLSIIALVVSSLMVASVLPIINLPMALRNLPIAVNGLPLVAIGNDILDFPFIIYQSNYRKSCSLVSLLKFQMQKHLYEFQFGFRNNCYTKHVLMEITEKVRDASDKRLFICGVYLDLKKAFDTVDHSR